MATTKVLNTTERFRIEAFEEKDKQREEICKRENRSNQVEDVPTTKFLSTDESFQSFRIHRYDKFEDEENDSKRFFRKSTKVRRKYSKSKEILMTKIRFDRRIEKKILFLEIEEQDDEDVEMSKDECRSDR